ncbi:MAG: hypothetical protein F6K54_20325 [Okeania sp. SIO3B5]|uniref:hypothetical protein n=1 Tax=Okeania sp. SIO3B5 TaxID=2607811 RepID=UPI001400C257|nr:hypothetical protein [Okeania sp. SIO3B5]NEO55215.1 hypothetical protein [Okeania sp. SIO3B5]
MPLAKIGLYNFKVKPVRNINLLVNADCNGTANILKKVTATLRFSLKEVSRGSLIVPLRIQFWIA